MPGDLSPAEAYAQARQRATLAKGPLGVFTADLPHPLDDFQQQACEALAGGNSVLVAAPTGAGKTVIAQFAVVLAVMQDVRVFYTTPIKALSNQKYQELAAVYGSDRVGLLTGDTSINRDAQIVVMTTEVLRNMIYSGTDLTSLRYVVLDEVHYLGDRFRGPVWEEVIIHLPAHVLLVSLSATVSNAEEFGAWLAEVRGSTEVIVSEHRPVPLHNHVAVGTDLYPLFAPRGHEVNRDLLSAVRPFRQRGGGRDRKRGRPPRFHRPSRAAVIRELHADGLLPAICFIFSRNACDDAVVQCLAAGLNLTDDEQKRHIEDRLDDLQARVGSEDLGVLGFGSFAAGLINGFGAHHAGLIPQFKELVEELFTGGYLRVVFATETLALGVNMPARTVVLEKLTKFNGESHVSITPGEYTQLTGRAGRRGIDVEGHAVTVWTPDSDPVDIAALASKRSYALNSRFTPTYNMAANLLARMTREDAAKVLETSFAQFQADASVVGLAKKVRRNDEALEGYQRALQCDRGDFEDYFALRRSLSETEKRAGKTRSKMRQRQVLASLSDLAPGDVILLPSRRSFGACIVISPMRGEDDGVRLPSVLTESGKVWHLRPHEVTEPAVQLGHLRVPKKLNHRSPAERKRLLDQLADAVHNNRIRPAATAEAPAEDTSREYTATIEALRAQLRAHPCHACPDREAHARWAERAAALEKKTDSVAKQIEGRTASIAHVFNRVCGVLEKLQFLPHGAEVLRRIYGERDLLTAMSVRAGLWDGLSIPETAGLASSLVYEARREIGSAVRIPTPRLETRLVELGNLWRGLEAVETQARLPLTPEPELGIVVGIYRWAEGKSLDRSLGRSDIAAGDFVRWTKQTLDLLGQVEHVASPETAAVIRRCADSMRRGVVLD